MSTILKGAPVVAAMNEANAARCAALREKGVVPTLAVVRVGERPDDLSYEKGVMARCAKVGVEVKQFLLPADAAQEELLRVIAGINADAAIHGCLLFRPLPKQFDDRTIRAALSPEKDIDGITDGSLAGVFTNTAVGYPPCTAQACLEILKFYNIPLSGKRAVVVGRSLVVGKPAAMMLDRENATVTLCNSRTQNLPDVCREADVVVVAMGRMGFIGAEHLRAGQVVVDVGIHVNEEGKLCGDVRFGEAEPVVEAITPVPGGVGTVTSTILASHVVEAAERAATAKKQPQFAPSQRILRTASAARELDIRGMETLEAESVLDNYIDAAVMAHLETVTIIHGKGTGALRKAVHASLRRNKAVKGFRLGNYGEGESGVTVVELK